MAMNQMLIYQHQYLARMFVEVLAQLEFIYEVVIRPFAELVPLVEQVEQVAQVVMVVIVIKVIKVVQVAQVAQVVMVAMVIKAEQVIMEPFIAHFLFMVIKPFYFMIIIVFVRFVFSFFNLSQLINQSVLIFSIALIQPFYFINFYLLIAFIIFFIVIQVFIKLQVLDILAFDSKLYLD